MRIACLQTQGFLSCKVDLSAKGQVATRPFDSIPMNGIESFGAIKGLSDRSATAIIAAFLRSFRLRKADILQPSGWLPALCAGNQSAVGGLVMPAFPFGNLRSHTIWNSCKLGRLKFHFLHPYEKTCLFQQSERRAAGMQPGAHRVIKSGAATFCGSSSGQPKVVQSCKELILRVKPAARLASKAVGRLALF